MTSVPSLICRVLLLSDGTSSPPRPPHATTLVNAYVHQTLHCLSVPCEVRLPMQTASLLTTLVPRADTATSPCPACGDDPHPIHWAQARICLLGYDILVRPCVRRPDQPGCVYCRSPIQVAAGCPATADARQVAALAGGGPHTPPASTMMRVLQGSS